jgi:tRNA threonylcarbamoyladenosine modification (KEOPS) complex Cgi121 subunit
MEFCSELERTVTPDDLKLEVFVNISPEKCATLSELLFKCILEAAEEARSSAEVSIDDCIAKAKESLFFLNLDFVYNIMHIENAVLRSFLLMEVGSMKTKTFDNEVMYQLSASTKINESVKLYSIHEGSTASNIALVCANPYPEIVKFDKLVEIQRRITLEMGEYNTPSSTIGERLLNSEKVEKLQKFFKFTPEEKAYPNMEDMILTRIAIKDYMN